jgi:hypothetical protein
MQAREKQILINITAQRDAFNTRHWAKDSSHSS